MSTSKRWWAVFREVWRVLRDDGTLWLNVGDSYATRGSRGHRRKAYAQCAPGLKEKDLVGIPWMLAFALRADGWYLRSDIIWSKPNPMPESVTDRPTKAHEYLFLFAKGERYYYDAAAIREPLSSDPSSWKSPDGWDTSSGNGAHGSIHRLGREKGKRRSGNKERKFRGDHGGVEGSRSHRGFGVPWEGDSRNRRTVWTVATKPFKSAHFATFPPELITPCILAGAPRGGVVLDPFGGAGTTGLVADRLGRDSILIELNPAYAAMARERIRRDAPLLAQVEA